MKFGVRAMVREVWDRFLLYLPLAFMGVLALGTYWMVRSVPQGSVAQVATVQRHTPDYFMEGFSVKTFDTGGRLRSEVLGEQAHHYPDTQWLEIDAIRIRSFDDKGNLTTATAKKGFTNEDGSEVQLIGDAYVVREPGEQTGAKPTPRMEYRGEFLHAYLTSERLESNKPVELVRGNDHFTADAMDFDNVEQVVKLRGHVHGTLAPQPAQ